METLLTKISSCELCKAHLPLGPYPIVAAHSKVKVVIISQAPGGKAHRTGIPWDDPGGQQLRKWLGVTDEEFYEKTRFAFMPMGFCYPGKGVSGDLPPRPECAPLWHKALLERMSNLQLAILVGQYSQKYYLAKAMRKNLTETVKAFEDYLPTYLPLPHPSPRNRFWLTKNPWFEEEVLPALRTIVKKIIEK
ncbi:uracil-DNA glycosylase family protein [Sungkyunkwania multivorans]|uniref:Uracil-DNA glycosylase family protein n=1 Tax=Sungkyunkwania multivorans TaxID=1173618 RepID=A0ABW3D2E8_9FLAO